VPGGRFGLWLNTLLPTSVFLLLMLFTDRGRVALGLAFLLAGPLLYGLRRAVGRGAGPGV
jgi:hypothetical protein